MDELFGKVAVSLTTEIFKEALISVQHLGNRLRAHDFAGVAARKYAESVERRYNSMRIFGILTKFVTSNRHR
jgi:hypothetical protein